MTNTNKCMPSPRDAFEAYFAESRKGRGKSRFPTFARLPDGTYADNHTQRHWWTWQQASAARPTDSNPWRDAVIYSLLAAGISRPEHHDDPLLALRELSQHDKQQGAAAAQAQPLTDEQVQRVMSAVDDYMHAYAEYRDEQDLDGIEAATQSAWPAVAQERTALEAVLRGIGAPAGATGEQA